TFEFYSPLQCIITDLVLPHSLPSPRIARPRLFHVKFNWVIRPGDRESQPLKPVSIIASWEK
ncbi:hypothetical protein RIF25_07115, partial [Thermosynechococcaceae cyanobacterium BACA0444]